MTDRDSSRGTRLDRDHYGYAHYADDAVAQSFDVLRFSGPVGRYLLESQERLLVAAMAPAGGRRILDVGSGTGRAAIGLAAAGGDLLGLDASPAMLRVARARAAEAGVALRFLVADAHQLPVADRGVDAAVSLRVLMHAVDWRQCVAELCRVSHWRVVVDFPALISMAAFESVGRRVGQVFGRRVEAYRVMPEAGVAAAFAAHGFRVVSVHRQFVLPVALHKTVGRLAFTRSTERVLAAAGLLRLLGSPVTMVAER